MLSRSRVGPGDGGAGGVLAEMVRDGDVGGGDGAAAGLLSAVWGALLQEPIDVAVILNAL